MKKKGSNSRLRLSAALAALWLSACGGGGDGMEGAAAPAAGGVPSFIASVMAAIAGSSWTQAYPTAQIWH